MLTLNAAFLNQLAYGSYTMQIDCTNGSTVTCVFNIAAGDYQNPDDENNSTGDNVHVKGTDEELYFNSTSAIKDVYISGRWIDPANYSLSTDGKMLTLNAAFLNQLAYGSYTMQIGCTNDSTVTCVFSIAATIIASGSCGENLTWTLDENGLLTISGTGDMEGYDTSAPWKTYATVIKSVEIEFGVTSVGLFAFSGCPITSVTIPESVTSIGYCAFYDCDALTSVTIPESVTSIGDDVFFHCGGLTNVTIGNSVTAVGARAFSQCAALTSVTIPDSVTSIGNSAFYNCSALTSVTIPDSVMSIGDRAFYGCTALTDVYYLGTKAQWYTISMGANNEALLNAALHTAYMVSYNANGGEGAPEAQVKNSGEDITLSTVIPTRENHKFLGWRALTHAGVTVYQPGDVYTEDADIYLTAMWRVVFGKCGDNLTFTLDEAGTLAISGAGDMYDYKTDSAPWRESGEYITSITVGEGVTSIGAAAFGSLENLKNLSLPSTLNKIGDYAIGACTSLTSVTIPENVSEIGIWAFTGLWSLKEISIPGSVAKISDYAFAGCNALRKLTLNSGTTAIGKYAFTGCTSLTELALPDGLETVDESAFKDCEVITKLTVPASVTSIADGAFSGCTALTDVYYLGTKAQWDAISIGADNEPLLNAALHTTYTVYYDANGGEGAPAAQVKNSGEDITLSTVIPTRENHKFLGWRAFTPAGVMVYQPGDVYTEDEGIYLTAMWRVVSGRCGDNLTFTLDEAGTLAISGAGDMYDYKTDSAPWRESGEYITSITVGEGVTSIGAAAFGSLENLKNLSLPSTLNKIGDYAIGACTSLTSVTIPENVSEIGIWAFTGLWSLKEISIPGSVAKISDYAFAGCNALRKLTLNSGTTAIGKYAFTGCTSLTELALPDGLETVDESAFKDCEVITKLTVPVSVTSIADGAFSGCTALTDVYYLGAKAQWDAISIGANNEPLLNAVIHTGYMVSYDANGGEGAPAAQVKEKGKALKLSTDIPTRRHFTFLGWAVSKTAKSAQYKAGASYTKDADITLYAVWKPVLATKITVTPASATLCGANRTLELTASVLPSAADDTVTWSSSNEKIATVDENGVVTTHGVYGTVTITAAAADGSRKTGKCTLTVRSPLTEALTIRDSDGRECSGKAVFFPLISGSKYQYTAERTPTDSASAVKWTSSNARVVTVSAAGLVSVKGVGSAVITAKSADTNAASASFTVSVVNFTPALSAKTVTINSFFDNGTDISVTCAPDSSLMSLELYTKSGSSYVPLDKIDVEDMGEAGFRLRAVEAKRASYSAFAKAVVFCEGIGYVNYYLPLRIAVVNTAPTVKVTGEKINTFYPNWAWGITPAVKGGTVEHYELGADSNPYFELTDGRKLRLSEEGIAAVMANPKASIARTPVKLVFSFENTKNTVTVSYRPTVVCSKPRLAARDAQTGKAVSYVTFNRFFNADAVEFELYDSASKAAVMPGSCTVSDPAQVFGVDNDGSTIGLTCNDYDAKKSRAVLEFKSDDWLTPVRLTMNVKYAAAPKMTLTASGRIDLIDRAGTGITYTPRFTNTAGSVMQGMKLETVKDFAGNDVTDAFELTYDHGTGKAVLRANEGYALVKKAYSVTVSAELALGGETCTVYTTVRVTPVQTALRLKAPAMKIKQGGGVGIVIETVPAGCELASAEVSIPKTAAGKLTAEIDAAEKLLTVAAADDLNPGTYTLTVAALPKDAAVGTAPTKLSVRVTVVKGDFEIAYVTDIGPINDGSINQNSYEGVERFAAANGLKHKYYQPANGSRASDNDRFNAMKAAVESGAKVVVCTGFMQGAAVERAAKAYRDVKFIFIDGWQIEGLNNLAAINFKEEECGFLAGYAAVKDGYESLGFSGGGGGTNPSCCRYGYGFVQGASAAAAEMGKTVYMKYSWLFGESYSASEGLEKMLGEWYNTGTKAIFCCGGSMYMSAVKAAEKYGGKVIGVEVDQSQASETVITSAMKNLGAAAEWALTKAYNGTWSEIGGVESAIGAAENAAALPMAASRFNTWSEAEYAELLKKLAGGEIAVDSNYHNLKSTSSLTIDMID